MTVRSTVVALLDPLFGSRVSSDHETRGGMTFPYVLVHDAITEGAAMKGDRKVAAWRHQGQVDLYQRMADEDQTIVDGVIDVLDGAKVAGGTHLAVQGFNRLYDPDPAVVHHTITYSLARLRG